jgi:stress response protein YsnF
VEKPAEETIALKNERATVERRPVSRPATAADDAFKQKTIEIDETAEEPVVEKKSRVVEEVRVGKQAEEREQTVRDKVRSTEVHVERNGEKTPMSASGSSYDGPERRKSASSNYSGIERRMFR